MAAAPRVASSPSRAPSLPRSSTMEALSARAAPSYARSRSDERPSRAQHVPDDDDDPRAAALLKGPSVYLDAASRYVELPPPGQHAAPEAPEAPEHLHQIHPDDTRTAGKPRKPRVTRAERLAAEQAVWVRDKFDLPADERLIASFSAALVRNILIQGRIHITTAHLCFYAKIFGRVTKEAVSFSRVARVKKRRGGFVANAIKIYFNDPAAAPIVIGSLNHRERTFNIIQDRLRELNPAAAEWPDVDDTASAASVPPSEDRSLEDVDESPESVSRKLSRDASLPAPARARHGLGESATSLRDDVRPPSDLTSDMSSRKSSDNDAAVPADEPSQRLVWRTADDVVDRLHASSYAKRTERARAVLDAPVLEAFNVLFVSAWLKTYHDSTNNRDVDFSDWYRGPDGFMTREVSFRRPLGYKIGPKETRVNEKHRYSFTREGGVILELEGRNLDAPYGDYFVVESFFELKPIDNRARTLFIASIAVHFNKSTILRSKIESGALQETKVAFQKIADLASKRIEEYTASRPSRPRLKQKPSGDGMTTEGALPPPPTTLAPATVGVVAPGAEVSGGVGPLPVARAAMPGVGELGMASAAARGEARSAGAVIEVQDAATTRWLRVVGIGALVMVCVLLLTVTVQLHRMQNKVSALEKLLVSKEQMLETGRCDAEACSGAGHSL